MSTHTQCNKSNHSLHRLHVVLNHIHPIRHHQPQYYHHHHHYHHQLNFHNATLSPPPPSASSRESSNNNNNNNNNILSDLARIRQKHFTNNNNNTVNTIQNNDDNKDRREPRKRGRSRPRINRNLVGFPRTVARATIFSRFMEQVYAQDALVLPTGDLVEMPKGDPPPLEKVFRHVFGNSDGNGLAQSEGDKNDDNWSLGGGHVCVVGPTGSGKSTIVRSLLVQLARKRNMAIYSLEYPVEVNLNTHGLFHVCQLDMFQEIQGKQRSLAETANRLLKHDPDLIYFGELRNKVDFETATSIALSGVGVISTGHASSPIDLLERLRSMNIDLQTQFRAFKCILGVKRVPILCPYCKRQVLLSERPRSSGRKHDNNDDNDADLEQEEQQNRVIRMLNLYRIVTLDKSERRKVLPIVCMPPEPSKGERSSCPHCTNGYIGNHTIYEYLYITPNSDMESLRRDHTYTTEETLIGLILEGRVNPLYLESVL